MSAFVLGLIIGAVLGVLAVALAMAAGSSEREHRRATEEWDDLVRRATEGDQ